jgi:hypothetical protein
LDDLHGADEPSLLLLRFLARELGASRLLVLGAYRDVDPTIHEPLSSTLAELVREPVTRTLWVGGLSEDDVARFIELTTAQEPLPGLAETVHSGTDGNPLFVGEVVRLLASEGRLDEPGQRLAVPQTLKEVIAQRLRHLSPECKELLSLASVLGREFDLELLAGASGLERGRVLELLDEAISEQLVTDVPGSRARLRFGHALFRDGLYNDLLPSRRRQLHEAAGEAIQKLFAADLDPHLAELAHHFCEAVPLANPAKAVEYAVRAGDRAVGLLAPEEAVRQYETALSLADVRERPRVLLRTARSIWIAGAEGSERAVAARDALLAASDCEGAAEAELLLANIHWFEGRRQLVSDDMQRALKLVHGSSSTPTTAEVLDHASRFHMLADENEEAIRVGREALAIAEQLGLKTVRAHCLSSIGVARARLGDPGGFEDLQTALEIAIAAQDGWSEWRARVNLADCLLWQMGEAEPAFAQRHELRRLLHAAGAWPITRWSQSYDAWESYWRGAWTETVRLCDAFIEHVEAGNPHNVASEMYTLRALVRASRRDERALDDARAAATLGRRAQDPRCLFPAIAFNAQIAAEFGRLEEANQLVDELAFAEGPEPFPAYVVPLALAALACGRAHDVLARLERLGRSAWWEAAEAMLQGAHLEAAERFARIGVLPEEAHARLLAAETFATSGRSDDAEAQAARCLSFYAPLGATAYEDRARKLHTPDAHPK